MLTTLEGRMGSGKSLAAISLAYVEYLRREILISALEAVMKGIPWDDAAAKLVEGYQIGSKVAIGHLQEAMLIYEREGEEAFRDHKKIISNNHLNFPYTHFDPQYLLEHIEDEEIEDCIWILDEAYQMGLDSRSTSTKYNKLMSYIVAQTRKRGVDLYMCTHHIDALEKRIRRAVDVRGTCRFNKGPLEEDKAINRRRYNWATVRLRDLRTGNGRRIRIYGPAFWSLYDTTERIPFTRKMVEMEL